MSGFGDEDDDHFRPVWEDNADEEAGDLPFQVKPVTGPKLDDPKFFQALLDTEREITKLDARVGAAPKSVQIGLIARLAFREAAGWLARASQWVHPHDLALRDLGLTGSYIASAKIGKLRRDLPNTLTETAWAEDENTVVGDRTIGLALAFTRVLRQSNEQVLVSADTVQQALSPLGWVIDEFSTRAVKDWLLDYREDSKTLPSIVAASIAAAVWREIDHGTEDECDLRASFMLATILGQKLKFVPLPFWTSRPSLSGLQRGGSPFGKNKTNDVCKLITESTLSTSRELDRLLKIAERATELTADMTKRSHLRAALDVVIRTPVITPKSLACMIGISPQAAIRLLNRIVDAGVVKEVTGRKSFRGFAT